MGRSERCMYRSIDDARPAEIACTLHVWTGQRDACTGPYGWHTVCKRNRCPHVDTSGRCMYRSNGDSSPAQKGTHTSLRRGRVWGMHVQVLWMMEGLGTMHVWMKGHAPAAGCHEGREAGSVSQSRKLIKNSPAHVPPPVSPG